MKNCHEFEALIDRVHADEASSEENDRVLEHTESCRACNDLFDLVGRVRAESEAIEPAAADFAAMRLGVLREMSRVQDERPRSFRWTSFQAMFLRPAFVVAISVVMLGLGWMIGGRDGSGQAPVVSAGNDPVGTNDEILASQIQRVAAGNSDFEDVANSPFVYSNVKVEASTPQTVRLSFDVSRHLDLDLSKSDPLVTEVLVQSLIQPASTGTKLKAIDLTGDVLDPRVRRALVVAMQNDENLGVRMTAQSKLAEYENDDEITAAMLGVLEHEQTVQMRLAAIDYLTKSQVRPELLERAIESSGPDETNSAIYLRASHYLTNKSAGSH